MGGVRLTQGAGLVTGQSYSHRAIGHGQHAILMVNLRIVKGRGVTLSLDINSFSVSTSYNNGRLLSLLYWAPAA